MREKESEKDVEKYLAEQVDAAGGLCRKYVSPGVRGVPDRICIMPGGKTIYVELKSEGEEPTPHQVREHQRMELRHHQVYIIDTKAKVEELLVNEVFTTYKEK